MACSAGPCLETENDEYVSSDWCFCDSSEACEVRFVACEQQEKSASNDTETARERANVLRGRAMRKEKQAEGKEAEAREARAAADAADHAADQAAEDAAVQGQFALSGAMKPAEREVRARRKAKGTHLDYGYAYSLGYSVSE